MKHILSTITVLFILLTSSVSWSEEVGYGDLRIGSDKSVIDEHCELTNEFFYGEYSFKTHYCYQNEEVEVSFWLDKDKKIDQIDLNLGVIFENQNNEPYPINDILTDPYGKYLLVRKQLEKKYEITSDFTNFQKQKFEDRMFNGVIGSTLNTFFDDRTVRLYLSKINTEGKIYLGINYYSKESVIERKQIRSKNLLDVLDKL